MNSDQNIENIYFNLQIKQILSKSNMIDYTVIMTHIVVTFLFIFVINNQIVFEIFNNNLSIVCFDFLSL